MRDCLEVYLSGWRERRLGDGRKMANFGAEAYLFLPDEPLAVGAFQSGRGQYTSHNAGDIYSAIRSAKEANGDTHVWG